MGQDTCIQDVKSFKKISIEIQGTSGIRRVCYTRWVSYLQSGGYLQNIACPTASQQTLAAGIFHHRIHHDIVNAVHCTRSQMIPKIRKDIPTNASLNDQNFPTASPSSIPCRRHRPLAPGTRSRDRRRVRRQWRASHRSPGRRYDRGSRPSRRWTQLAGSWRMRGSPFSRRGSVRGSSSSGSGRSIARPRCKSTLIIFSLGLRSRERGCGIRVAVRRERRARRVLIRRIAPLRFARLVL